MRYGIISDIHSNLTALDAVLEKLGDVDAMVSPGDVVGYGPDPNECCERLRSLGCITVIGNHDAAVAGLMDMSWFNADARRAALWTREVLSEANTRYIGALATSYASDHFLMVHATLAQPLAFHYVFSTSTARPCFEEMGDYKLCFIGHTHISEVYVQKVGTRTGIDQLSFRHGGRLDLRAGFRYIVNCGSVGQPRDGNPDAACGIYDSEANALEILRVPYDIGAVQSRMLAANLPGFLINRLEYGE